MSERAVPWVAGPARRVIDALRACGRVRTIGVDAAGRASVFEGSVEIRRPRGGVLELYETLETSTPDGRRVRGHNAYRWRLDESAGSIGLEHLRLGAGRPVWLVELAARGGERGELASGSAHVCGRDRYHARVRAEGRGVLLRWRIESPGGRARIDSRYWPGDDEAPGRALTRAAAPGWSRGSRGPCA